jgi:ketosteroid isomerase-like protein
MSRDHPAESAQLPLEMNQNGIYEEPRVSAADDGRRQSNFRLYDRMRLAQNARDHGTWLSCFTEDVVFEAPYYRDGAPMASGRHEMSAIFARMNRIFSSVNYELKRFIPAVDPDIVLAQVRGDNTVASNGNRYRNDYMFVIECRDGKIGRILEYSNPMAYSDAVGTS